MAAAWLATIKAVLPYVDHVVSVVSPVFTKRKMDSISSQSELLQRQIDELQQAAAQNTASVKELAEQLKRVVLALDQAAVNLEAANRRHWTLCIIAVALSAVSLAAVLVLAMAR